MRPLRYASGSVTSFFLLCWLTRDAQPVAEPATEAAPVAAEPATEDTPAEETKAEEAKPVRLFRFFFPSITTGF